MLRTLCFHYEGEGSIPDRGTKIPQGEHCRGKKKDKDSLVTTTK